MAEAKQNEGVLEENNTYRSVGPTPTMNDEVQMRATQKQLTQEWMVHKNKQLMEVLSRDQQVMFCDNKAAIKVLDVVPKGIYRSLTNQQVAANLNIFCLRPKHSGNLCQCGKLNSLAHFEVCEACPNVALMTSYRHNAIRDLINTTINTKSKELRSSKEPMVYENHPNIINQERADLKINAKDGMPQQHEYYGLFDIMTKVTSSSHTKEERDRAEAMARQEGVQDNEKIRRREIQAALQVGFAQKIRKYRDAKAAGIQVNPMIISTAGTLHKVMYKVFKKWFPDSNQRRGLLLDIAVFMARGRGQLYARDLGIIELAAAAGDADADD